MYFKLCLILAVLCIPLMAVDCCRGYETADHFKIKFIIEDTSNHNNVFLTSSDVILRVLKSPHPGGADSASDFVPNNNLISMYLNPDDSVTRATITFDKKTDTITFRYHKGELYYNSCQQKYGRQILPKSGVHTNNWLGDKARALDTFTTADNMGFANNTFVLYFKK